MGKVLVSIHTHSELWQGKWKASFSCPPYLHPPTEPACPLLSALTLLNPLLCPTILLPVVLSIPPPTHRKWHYPQKGILLQVKWPVTALLAGIN